MTLRPELLHGLIKFPVPHVLLDDVLDIAGCGKSPLAAFSRHSAAHRTARVRFTPGTLALTDSRPSADVTLILLRVADLAVALLDGLLGHPVACSDAGRHVEPSVRYDTKSEFFRNLLDRHPLPVSLPGASVDVV